MASILTSMPSVIVVPGSKLDIRAKLTRDMIRRGKNVESAAKRRIGRNPRRVDTGRLRASIQAKPILFGGLPAVQVGTPVKYSLYVHNGTRYMIPNPYLRDALPAMKL